MKLKHKNQYFIFLSINFKFNVYILNVMLVFEIWSKSIEIKFISQINLTAQCHDRHERVLTCYAMSRDVYSSFNYSELWSRVDLSTSGNTRHLRIAFCVKVRKMAAETYQFSQIAFREATMCHRPWVFELFLSFSKWDECLSQMRNNFGTIQPIETINRVA